jgi:transposase, IS30 family
MKRTHLTLDERYLIHACLVAQLSMNDMAAELNRHRSTLHAEIRRGRNPAGHYCPLHAQRGSESARALSVANAPRKSAAEWDKVEAQLKGGHSPEQISGRRQLLHDACPISPQAIYNATVRNDWTHHLYRSRVRRLLKRPAPRPWQGKSTSIHQRDPEVYLRIALGDWEADCALGKKRDQQRTLVLVERQSLYEQLVLLPNGTAKVTAQRMKKALLGSGLPFRSVTTDRGGEFSTLGDMFPDKAYVCDAYQPNQRGTNENQIGRLRADLPKGQSMDTLTQAQLTRIQYKHNHTPRKCLGFLTPHEVAFRCPPRVAFRT